MKDFIRENWSALITFGIVGSLTAGINFGAFSLCWRLIGMPYTVAASISYCLSVMFHFNVNRRVTFGHRDRDYLHQIVKYIGLVIANYFITIAVIRFSVGILHFSPYVGLLMAIIIMMILSFLTLKFWVFKSRNRC